jgi:protein lifeguard
VGFVQIFFPFSEGFQLAIAFAGVLIFSGYIIFGKALTKKDLVVAKHKITHPFLIDTYMIFNRYSPEDYILASVSLYMDFINLFLRILQILSAMQRD